MFLARMTVGLKIATAAMQLARLVKVDVTLVDYQMVH